jgi:hypothetical protein
MKEPLYTPADSIPLSTVLAVLGLKIEECDLGLKMFPQSDYLRGQRDALVNAMAAMRKAVLK